MSESKWHVEVAYRFKKKRPGVLLGMTIEAPNREIAEDIAEARHITPYPSRILLYIETSRAHD